MKKWLLRIFIGLFILLVAGYGYVRWRLRDRHPGYSLDLRREAPAPGPIRAGFAAVSITPEIVDRWTDQNGDAQYNPADGDYYEDGNGNARFDGVWLAGFQNKRPATGIHDSLWARVMVLDDGHTRMAVVVLDAIGVLGDVYIDIRKRLPQEWGIHYATFSSSHTHEAPDVIGMWGSGDFYSGVDPAYIELIKERTLKAIGQAVERLRPARLRFAQDLEGAIPLVEDTRLPNVLDPGIRLIQVLDAEADTTLGSVFAWANHPETLWNENLLITSDFPHYVRECMEKGVFRGDSLAAPGLGGVSLYLNGAIGGLMTTSPGFGVRDPFEDTTYLEPSFDKARAQGQRLALLGLQALRDSSVVELGEGAISLRARTLDLPLSNKLYQLAAILGVIERGTTRWMHIRTEVAAWRLGPASFLLQPGELYPEILNGGVEAPSGADFPSPIMENPPLRSLMPGDFTFIVGLSNDMIGYIIPHSHWDQEPPFLGGAEEGPYGEINSVGPQTAPILYQALRDLLAEIGE